MSHQSVPEHHRRVIQALQSGPRAPDRLHRRIEAMEPGGAWRLPRMPALRDRSALRPWLRPALVTAVLAVALVAALSLGTSGSSRVVQAAELSLSPSTEAPPPTNRQEPALLRRSFAGVTFPAWSGKFGWRTDGARSDELDGRETQTVFYKHTHHRIGYTVISGQTIEPPEDAEELNVGGVELHRFRLGRQDVVTFERGGRTCVLSGDVHDPDTLVKLAVLGRRRLGQLLTGLCRLGAPGPSSRVAGPGRRPLSDRVPAQVGQPVHGSDRARQAGRSRTA